MGGSGCARSIFQNGVPRSSRWELSMLDVGREQDLVYCSYIGMIAQSHRGVGGMVRECKVHEVQAEVKWHHPDAADGSGFSPSRLCFWKAQNSRLLPQVKHYPKLSPSCSKNFLVMRQMPGESSSS